MTHKLREELKTKATELAQQWAMERGVCGEERFKMLYENALIVITAEECASLAYNLVPAGDVVASAILYLFDIDGARSMK